MSRVKWSNPGKGVAIEKGAFGSPSTTIANFAYFYPFKYSYLPIARGGGERWFHAFRQEYLKSYKSVQFLEYVISYNCKLYVLKMVTWSYNCFVTIIIIS